MTVVSSRVERAQTNRGHLYLVPQPEPTELTKMARRDPDVLELLRLIAREGLREEAIQLLGERCRSRSH